MSKPGDPVIKPQADILAEKGWGESLEVAILRRWLAASDYAKAVTRVIKSHEGSAHDFLLLNKLGFPCVYVEVKRRRTDFGKYGDAIFPFTKHEHAKRIKKAVDVPFIGVTEYGDGTLVEVALFTKPDVKKDVQRRDRTHIPPVPHAFYSKAQLTVLEGARAK
jgi:hypothetical protein